MHETSNVENIFSSFYKNNIDNFKQYLFGSLAWFFFKQFLLN